jgi:hypothetical protein
LDRFLEAKEFEKLPFNKSSLLEKGRKRNRKEIRNITKKYVGFLHSQLSNCNFQN